ncbi:M23 family metallopeptidase [Patiriisocius marinus]|uniref:M23ase beta-sheet core domain-containing protein n=1 Tax=Patiriisocius marinus TaxID=1397112 RepID=A0A5J4IXM8_9FLAO|nr:M23 family metallopeptidase [Patiriisocius marinus]GER59132.1 hypothetical protein ULMA_12400 [Patiriisocius marinus]
MRYSILLLLFLTIISCTNDDDTSKFTTTTATASDDINNGIYGNGDNNGNDSNNSSNGCAGDYPEWLTSPYVLPYPVGKTYQVALSHCSGSYHSPGQPDQYAIDFRMNIGTLITAAREGTVVYVQESGTDYMFPNNIVVVKHGDGTYAQYMHLTKNGALVTPDSFVAKGDSIGYSGATGLAGYPHLHFVVTQDSWPYPYTSIPYNFKNTASNPRSLNSGRSYTAEPY